MSKRDTNKSPLSSGAGTWVRIHSYEIDELPDQPFERTDAPDWVRDHVEQLTRYGILKKETPATKRKDKRGHIWYIPEDIRRRIRQLIGKTDSSDGLLGCGHDPFVNEGEDLRCKRCEKLTCKECLQLRANCGCSQN